MWYRIKGFDAYQIGDTLECYTIEKVAVARTYDVLHIMLWQLAE